MAHSAGCSDHGAPHLTAKVITVSDRSYRGEREEADRIGGEAMDYLGRHELEVDTVFDLGLWGRTLMGWIIRYPVYCRGTVYNKIP